MKKLVVLLLVSIILSTTAYANTYEVQYENYALKLKEMGVFKGTSTGFELDREPTRIEVAVMFVRLLGAEQEALERRYEHPFTDVPGWANDYVGYLYHEKLTNGIGASTFGSNDYISAKSYMTFILRALGYNDSVGDFSWDTALEFAKENQLISKEDYTELNEDKFLRDHVAKYSYLALLMWLKDCDMTLVNKLLELGVIDENTADDIEFIVSEDVIEPQLGELEVYNPLLGQTTYFSITYFNGFFYLSDWFDDLLYKSRDGITWTNVGCFSEPTLSVRSNATYINGKYRSIEYDDELGYVFWTSSDLFSWEKIRMYRSPEDKTISNYDYYGGYFTDFTYGNGKYIIFGEINPHRDGYVTNDHVNTVGGEFVLISEDFYTWKVIDIDKIFDSKIRNVIFENKSFYAISDAIYKSTDGESWEQISDLDIRSVQFINGMYWGILDDSVQNIIMKSSDLENWSKVELDYDCEPYGIRYGGGIYIMYINYSNHDLGVLVSTDGESWDLREGSAASLYGNGIFLSVIEPSLILFGGEEREIDTCLIKRVEVLNPIDKESSEYVEDLNNESEQIDTQNLILLKDSLSLKPTLKDIFTDEVIEKIQSYPYNSIEYPKYDFEYMKIAIGPANDIIEDFYSIKPSPLASNQLFLTYRYLSYVSSDSHYFLRGILQEKLEDGTTLEQHVEFEYKPEKYNPHTHLVEYELVEMRILNQ